MPALVASPALEVLHLLALEVEVGEQDDLLFVELAELFGDDHVGMGVLVVQLDDVVVLPEPRGDLDLQTGAREALPVHLPPPAHQLVRLRDRPVEGQDFA